ncbi:hypothetical protein HERIO_1710 [Hepatospora eriocheir]|uniref:ISXO2-like transposase domain-containing protein n=1 Tax=Hepatospora eriocheir TaxID=1081669 RepID=A0A1X0Q977_9MICR|nr:hypothetical protein HERIO_1710 [Hepatospora eriocheir]
MQVVNKRDAKIPIPIFKKRTHIHSTIHTDCQKAYSRVNKDLEEDFTANHSKLFINLEIQCHNHLIQSLRGKLN